MRGFTTTLGLFFFTACTVVFSAACRASKALDVRRTFCRAMGRVGGTFSNVNFSVDGAKVLDDGLFDDLTFFFGFGFAPRSDDCGSSFLNSSGVVRFSLDAAASAARVTSADGGGGSLSAPDGCKLSSLVIISSTVVANLVDPVSPIGGVENFAV